MVSTLLCSWSSESFCSCTTISGLYEDCASSNNVSNISHWTLSSSFFPVYPLKWKQALFLVLGYITECCNTIDMDMGLTLRSKHNDRSRKYAIVVFLSCRVPHTCQSFDHHFHFVQLTLAHDHYWFIIFRTNFLFLTISWDTLHMTVWSQTKQSLYYGRRYLHWELER